MLGAVLPEARHDPAIDGGHDARSPVDKPSVDLDRGCASPEHLVCIVPGHETPNTDDGEATAGGQIEHRHKAAAASGQRRAGETAGTERPDLFSGGLNQVAGDRRVGRDDPIETQLETERHDLPGLGVAHVRGDLHEERSPLRSLLQGQRPVALDESAQKRAERLNGLEVPKARRVWRAHVDHQIGRMDKEALKATHVV